MFLLSAGVVGASTTLDTLSSVFSVLTSWLECSTDGAAGVIYFVVCYSVTTFEVILDESVLVASAFT